VRPPGYLAAVGVKCCLYLFGLPILEARDDDGKYNDIRYITPSVMDNLGFFTFLVSRIIAVHRPVITTCVNLH